jgi:peptidoglycan/LPS O-acetylase OafA/YrhL
MATTLTRHDSDQPSTDEPKIETRTRLPHVAALDGLRGVAVLAVVVYHLNNDLLPGGFLGVSLFFTLSGFLITNLLLAEWEVTRSIGLRRFWVRRFRRLLPAALLALVVALLTAWWWADARQLADIRGDVGAALAYLANWRFIFDGSVYGAGFEQPSPVLHFWSLAIEEQFYVVVALVAVLLSRLARRRRAWLITFAGLAALSMLATLRLWGTADTNRVYFGSDTRAFELLAGVLLALLINFSVPARLTRFAARHVLTVAAALAMLMAFVVASTTQSWLYHGGLWLVALGSVILIVAALDAGPLAKALSWRPLVGLGLISYGVYVLHWPIFTFLTPETTGLSGVGLAFVRLAITLAIAVASYRWLEQPIRTGRVRLRSVPVMAGAVVITTGLLVAATMLDRTSAVRDVVATPDLALSSPAGAEEVPTTTVVPPPPLRRVLFVGDSLVHQSFNTLSARMTSAGIQAVAIGGEGEHLLSTSESWLAELEATLTTFDPDVVVLEACCGWGMPSKREKIAAADGNLLEPDTVESWNEWRRAAQALTDVVRAHGRFPLWVLAPPAQTNGYYGPIEGRIPLANDTYRNLVACTPGVGLIDWRVVAGPDGEFVWSLPDRSGALVEVRSEDGLHFTPEGQAVLADLTVLSVQTQWRSFKAALAGGGPWEPPAVAGPAATCSTSTSSSIPSVAPVADGG